MVLKSNQILSALIDGTGGSLPVQIAPNSPPSLAKNEIPTAAQILTRLVEGTYGTIPVTFGGGGLVPSVISEDFIILENYQLQVYENLSLLDEIILTIEGALVLL